MVLQKIPCLLHENHGGWYYEMQELGYNYRLTDFQAALGISQLERADQGLKKRRVIAKKYFEAFKNVHHIIGQSGYVEGHAYHLYIIEVEDRLGLYNYLRSKNIFVQVHYIPVHTLPYYQQLGWQEGDFPVAENYYKHCLSLPMFPTLTDEEQQYVIDRSKGIFQLIKYMFMKNTEQETFWNGHFGKEYTDRNKWNSDEEWDKFYNDTWGMTKLEINNKVLKNLSREIRVLEVGCNYGAAAKRVSKNGF